MSETSTVDTTSPADGADAEGRPDAVQAAGCASSGGVTLVAIIFVVWALFPALYVINLAFSGGNTLTAACPRTSRAWRR